MKSKKNIAIFGDISMNGIDGSSIWLQSISSIFPKDRFNVYLILRDKIISHTLLGELKNVNIVDIYNTPYLNKNNENPCSSYELFTILKGLNKDFGLDHIILRAPRYLKDFVEKSENQTYLNILEKVDAYFPKINIYEDDYEKQIILKAIPYIARIIVQTEEMRSYLDMVFPSLIGRVIVLNPVVPNFKTRTIKEIKYKLKKPCVIYAGKLDKQYYVEEFLDILLASESKKYSLKYVGSKLTTSKIDPQFGNRIKQKLAQYEQNPNFIWIKQLERTATIEQVASASFMLSVRQDIYDTSNEISTKLLEAMSVGALPILKKTAANVKLLGDDYPCFTNQVENIPDVVECLLKEPNVYVDWAKKLQKIAQQYTFDFTYQNRLLPFYEAAFEIDKKVLGSKKKILIASHDNKFLTRVINNLLADSNLEVKFDDWTTTLKHDAKKSKELLEWADIILCEWAVGAAVFYSQNKKPNQKLLVRLHRFEITTQQPQQINFDNVDKVIVVSDYIKNFCVENYRWYVDKIDVIPQYADVKIFNRSKIEMSEFNLGLLGAVPTLKRLDRALDIIEQLRQIDDRYVLYIKSRRPWEIPFVWNKKKEQDYFIAQYQRIEANPILSKGVIFDQYGADVAAWFRKIGWMLSTSDIEGCHTAVAEAMASGAKPIIFNWPGAESVYKTSPIFDDATKAVNYILKNRSFNEREIKSIKTYAYENFDLSLTIQAYVNFIYEEKSLEVQKI